MIIKFADKLDNENIISFFDENIEEKSGIISEEFLCPYGVKGAINRKQIVIIKNNDIILGAIRFYPRKKDNICSIYQFALDKTIRGKDLIKKMLFFTGYKNFQIQVFSNSSINNYFQKQNWNLLKSNDIYNYWGLKI